MTIKHLLPLTAITALMLTGCGDSTNDTAQDIRDTREEASRNVNAARNDADETIISAERDLAEVQQDLARANANARENLGEAEADASRKIAHAIFEVEEAEVDARNDIATEKCNTFTGVDKDACVSTAEANHASEIALAVSRRDNALVAADRNL